MFKKGRIKKLTKKNVADEYEFLLTESLLDVFWFLRAKTGLRPHLFEKKSNWEAMIGFLADMN